MNTPIVIEMINVSWITGNRYILKNINWSVHRGEHWAIIGLNGSGKTSLLNLVMDTFGPPGDLLAY